MYSGNVKNTKSATQNNKIKINKSIKIGFDFLSFSRVLVNKNKSKKGYKTHKMVTPKWSKYLSRSKG